MSSERRYFAISDLHLGHEKMPPLRGFTDIMDMFRHIKHKIFENPYICEDDIVYHVGDYALGDNKEKWYNFLPGKVIFIKGNHDPNSLTNIQNLVIKFRGYDFELVHRPEDATGKYKFIIHGHIHKTGTREMPVGGEFLNDIIYKKGKYLYYNVNCEFHKYKPKDFAEILGELKSIEK